MKVAIRTLQQKMFEVEAEPEHTVFNLKEKIGGVQGQPAEHLKLFYAGRTLTDDSKSVESLNLKEGSYLVVMPRANSYGSTNVDSGPSSSSVPPLPKFPRTDFTAPTAPTKPVSSGSTNPAPRPAAAPRNPFFNSNGLMSGSSMPGSSRPGPSIAGSSGFGSTISGFSVSEDSVQNLVEMGFERDQVVKALKASFDNKERAVEFLTTSIPENPLDDSDPFSSGSFSSGPGSSGLRPFGISSMSNPFSRPQPVGHIEEVGSDQPEEPSKPMNTESTASNPVKTSTEDIRPTESTSADATTTFESPPASLQNEAASSIAPTSSSSATVPAVPEDSSSISHPTPSTSSLVPTFSRPMGFSGMSAFGGLGSSSDGENVTLESLENDPMIQQIRELAGQNPELIGPLVEQLVQSKPQVANLMSSNPEGLARLLSGRSSSRLQSAFNFGESSGSGGDEAILESLRDDPLVQRIQELDASDPELFKSLLEQLVYSKPEVARLMATNPTGLGMLLCGSRSNASSESRGIGISVTKEEKEALERLEGLGFPRSMVIQAYFAFEKNEELAANYLVENCADDD
ncbi:UV excision repair protein RAD23 homolog B [Rhizoctonia solani]|uniref:UV excision repair protein RAD23 homolog B n=1 Tax=Rhizoctonia solani TaxID=456999 RepID=A0A0K6G7M2_9AGAM|nr:UV excision repair protein RAD23 homolog B [Rhizoctonia solani]